jgi:CDP-glycerol glycerophosphotransferase
VSARVSVVVPVYNVAAYLETCLESLAQQTMADLEVVMVDDGSTDESPEIGRRFVARDARFRLVHQANAGLGAARNTGVENATGEFVAFVDSDDVVTRHAYELLLSSLDRSGSDFASGNVRRLTPYGTTKTAFQSRALARTQLRTHITRLPYLLVDRTAWNKLYRKSFWDQHGFRFPEGVYYEDIPVTLPAHYLAESIDILGETVYLWRLREGVDLSITQRRTESKALRDRVAAVDHVSRFLDAQKLRVSKAIYDRSVLGADLRFFLDVLPNADDEYRTLFVDLANEFIERADKWAIDQPLAIDRLKWQLVRRHALPELLEVLRFEEEELTGRPPIRAGRRWYGDYPYRNDERLGIPSNVYRLHEELGPVFRLNAMRWVGDTLRIEGYAYITMIGAPQRDSQTVELIARPSSWRRRRVRLRADPTFRPDVTVNAAQEYAGLDWSGFVATLEASDLTRGGHAGESTWEIGAVIRAGGVVRSHRRPWPASLYPLPPAETTLDDGTQLRAALTSEGKLTVQVRSVPPVVRSYTLDEGVLQLEGDIGSGTTGDLELQLHRRIGAATLEYPTHVERSGRRRTFLARVPLEDLRHETDVSDDAPVVKQRADGVEWDIYLARDGRLKPLMLDETVPETTWTVNGREIALQGRQDGNLTVTERSVRPVITGCEWSSAGSLLVSGSFSAPSGEYELAVSARARGETYVFPLHYDAEAGRFTAEMTPGAVASIAGTHPLGAGAWQLSVGERGRVQEVAVGVVLDHALLAQLPMSAEIEHKRFHLGVSAEDTPVLAAERDLTDEERGGFAQRRLRTSFYESQRARTLSETVLYDCFDGREYSDSPRALHEELVRRDAPFDHLWVVRDRAFQVPDTAVPLRQGSRDYYEALGRARYVVTNDHWPRWFARRRGQTCVQTWHGVPLKRHGLALADWPMAVRQYRRVLSQRSENWEYVVSPGDFASPILEQAFPVENVVEAGMPRTDIFYRPDRDGRAAEVKRRLGLGEERVVLYAPTYRDHLDYRIGYRVVQPRDARAYGADLGYRDGYRIGPLLDIGALGSALSEDQILLVRKHPRVSDPPPLGAAEGRVRDVSGFPDAVGLLLVADVLVTDYSSLMFDFACLGRPLVFFTPDLEDYRDRIRGFSIDFEAVAPGPLLRTTAEVAAALGDLDTVSAEYGKRYESFVASFCSLSDGRASSRVVERVFDW